MNTIGADLSSLVSMTMKRRCWSTWVAARPMPGASYMVSNMSSTRRWSPGVVTCAGSTCAALVRRRGSGNSRMGSRAMAGAPGNGKQVRSVGGPASVRNSTADAGAGTGFLDCSRRTCWGIRRISTMLTRLRTVFAVAMLTVATYALAVEPAGTHPDTYVVRKGDTLWDIAGRFLQKPWLWPALWQANPQVANPHLIYPGDVLSLAYLYRVAADPGPRNEAPIGAIPLSDIEPFLKNLRVTDAFEHLPYVVAFEDNRLRGSAGQAAYVLNLPGAEIGQRYAVVRPTLRYAQPRPNQDLEATGNTIRGDGNLWKEFTPPSERNEFLGFELAQVNVGTITRLPGGSVDVATLALEDGNGKEVRPGDRLIPVEPQPYDLQF